MEIKDKNYKNLSIKSAKEKYKINLDKVLSYEECEKELDFIMITNLQYTKDNLKNNKVWVKIKNDSNSFIIPHNNYHKYKLIDYDYEMLDNYYLSDKYNYIYNDIRIDVTEYLSKVEFYKKCEITLNNYLKDNNIDIDVSLSQIKDICNLLISIDTLPTKNYTISDIDKVKSTYIKLNKINIENEN